MPQRKKEISIPSGRPGIQLILQARRRNRQADFPEKERPFVAQKRETIITLPLFPPFLGEAAMAGAAPSPPESPVKDLCYEVTCPICLEYFTDPVILPKCGHNFCRACLSRYWKEWEKEAASPRVCPQCREPFKRSNTVPNRQLASVVEIAKKLSPREAKGAEEGKGAVGEKRHPEPLKPPGREDETPIWVRGDRPLKHRDQEAPLEEELSHTCKDQIHNCLKGLKEERQQILAYEADIQNESQFLLNQIKAEKEKTVSAFRRLYRFLEEHEKLLLAKMDKIEKEIERKGEEHLAKLSEELFSLQNLIQDVEKTTQQPTSEILQDIGSILKKCHGKGKFEKTMVFPPTLKWRIWDFCDLTPFLVRVMEQFKDSLVFGLQPQIAHVTLDPDTAHPQLFLSEDHKSVRCRSKAQFVPSLPERFDKWESVLGLKGFSTGRHFWEVLVGSEETWAMGVAKRSVKRKGLFDVGPQEGIWAMGKFEGNYRGINLTENPILFLDKVPERIRVTLNCEGERVAFFDASTAALLFAFPAASFARQILHPWFWLCKKSPGHPVALRVETTVSEFAAVATTHPQPSLLDWTGNKSYICEV